MNTIFLFGPTFNQIGIDIVNSITSRGSIKIGALCTGGDQVVSNIKRNLRECLLFTDDLAAIEKSWMISEEIDYNYLAELDSKYGNGAVGTVITADRRVGLGFVRGGITRPDEIGDQALNEPVLAVQKYVQNLFKHLESLFDKYQFKGVFCYAVAGSPAVALGLICNARNIKFSCLSSTRIGDKYIIDTDFKGRLFPIASLYNSDQALSEEVLSASKRFLESYRNKPIVPEYMDQNISSANSNLIAELTLSFTLYFTAYLFKFLLPKRLKEKIDKLRLRRKIVLLGTEIRKQKLDLKIFEDHVEDEKFYYFPLHVDPEASTMVISPMHTDQIAIIESIAKSLPGDAILIVKEHLPMLGKREISFYKKIRNMPRVRLVSPYLNSHHLIRSSLGVVVITGTAAFEALLLGKKALIIGDSPFLVINSGLVFEPCLYHLPLAFKKLMNSDLPDDSQLIRYLACVKEKSFSLKSSAIYGNYSSMDLNYRKSLSDTIAVKILESFKNH